MMIALRKSTVRPCESVRRPSSGDLEQDVEDIRVGLLDLVEQQHRVRLAAHGLGQLAALVVADVAGASQPDGDRMLLHVLDMSIRTIDSSSPKRNSARVLASSVLPTPDGPRKTNEPVGRSGP